jgi:hypothetical protein
VLCSSEEVTLTEASIAMQGVSMALVKLTCNGSEDCSWKLTLSAKTISKEEGEKERSRTIIIGTEKFAILAC